MKLISIIVPCFNVDKYISKTIESIISQSYNNFEIICVNDGSTDNTLDILNKFKSNDSRIKILNKKNGGVSSARNEGIKNATGGYLFFLDGDDVISPELFQKMYNIISSRNRIDFISFGYKIVENSKIKSVFSNDKLNKRVFHNNQLLLLFLQKKLRQSMCSFVVRKDIIINNNILFNENTTNGEDQEFQIKCMYHSKESYYISDILFSYLQRNNSAISEFSAKYITLLDVFERLLAYISSNEYILYENLKIYALFTYFYVLKKAIRNNDNELIDLVLNKYEIFNYKIGFNKKFFVLKTIILDRIFKISPKLLINILKKV